MSKPNPKEELTEAVMNLSIETIEKLEYITKKLNFSNKATTIAFCTRLVDLFVEKIDEGYEVTLTKEDDEKILVWDGYKKEKTNKK